MTLPSHDQIELAEYRPTSWAPAQHLSPSHDCGDGRSEEKGTTPVPSHIHHPGEAPSAENLLEPSGDLFADVESNLLTDIRMFAQLLIGP